MPNILEGYAWFEGGHDARSLATCSPPAAATTTAVLPNRTGVSALSYTADDIRPNVVTEELSRVGQSFLIQTAQTRLVTRTVSSTGGANNKEVVVPAA